jgi:hypothetical protein
MIWFLGGIAKWKGNGLQNRESLVQTQVPPRSKEQRQGPKWVRLFEILHKIILSTLSVPHLQIGKGQIVYLIKGYWKTRKEEFLQEGQAELIKVFLVLKKSSKCYGNTGKRIKVLR